MLYGLETAEKIFFLPFFVFYLNKIVFYFYLRGVYTIFVYK